MFTSGRTAASHARCRRLGGLLSLLTLVALVVGSPDVLPQTEAGFGESVGVVVVEVPVRVLRRGRPVVDLTIDDFEILDRGVPQEIHGFERIDAYAPDIPVAPVVASPTDSPQLAIAPRGRHILLLFDLGLGGLPNRNHMVRSLKAARTMLREQLGPHDRVAVALTSTLLWGFSSDPDVVDLQLDYVQAVLDTNRKAAQDAQRALQEASDSSLPGAWDADYLIRLATLAGRTGEMGFSRDLEILREAADAGGGPAAALAIDDSDPMIDPSVAALLDTVEPELLEALGNLHQQARAKAQMIATLRGVPSPKYVLMFSAGLDGSIAGQELSVRAATTAALNVAIRGFVDAGWTLDTIDTEGVPVSGHSVDAVTNEGMPDSVRLSMGAWGRHEAYEEDALLYLARRTGGELQENTNRPEDATRQILRRNAVTYLLSFSPSALEGEGRYHELEVRLRNGSRAEIRHRPGYFEPEAGGGEPPAETALRDAELVLSGAGPAELGGGAIALPASSEPGQVPYFLELDGRHLADFGREVELELQVYAVHHDGSFRDATFRNFSVDVGKAGDLLRSADLRFTGSLDVEPGRYELRALVRERQSGQVSLLTSAFAVPAEGAPGPRLYLTALPSRRQVHVLQEGLKETSRGFEDFRSPQGTLLPSPEPDLGPDEILVAVLLAAPGTVAAPGAHILTSSGETVATLELVAAPADASNEDVQRWGVVLAAGQLAAGSYTLTVDVGPHGRLERHFTRRP